VLSPAVYGPEPPADSSARAFGAYGVGAVPFDDDRYAELSYPAALATTDRSLPLHLVVAAGDAEPLASQQALLLSRTLRDAPGVTVRWRRYPGGHGWDTWAPAFRDGLLDLAGVLAGASG
jgi:S-formylglutathione hydrolase FrmB